MKTFASASLVGLVLLCGSHLDAAEPTSKGATSKGEPNRLILERAQEDAAERARRQTARRQRPAPSVAGQMRQFGVMPFVPAFPAAPGAPAAAPTSTPGHSSPFGGGRVICNPLGPPSGPGIPFCGNCPPLNGGFVP